MPANMRVGSLIDWHAASLTCSRATVKQTNRKKQAGRKKKSISIKIITLLSNNSAHQFDVIHLQPSLNTFFGFIISPSNFCNHIQVIDCWFIDQTLPLSLCVRDVYHELFNLTQLTQYFLCGGRSFNLTVCLVGQRFVLMPTIWQNVEPSTRILCGPMSVHVSDPPPAPPPVLLPSSVLPPLFFLFFFGFYLWPSQITGAPLQRQPCSCFLCSQSCQFSLKKWQATLSVPTAETLLAL